MFPFNFPFTGKSVDILDKDSSKTSYIRYMFQRSRTMFSYKGLPDTIPQYMLELYLQINGVCCITEVKGKLYALHGSFGGPPDAYYRPTLFVVANPGLNFSANLDVNKDCVICKNDTTFQGLYPLFSRYAAQLSENDISIRSTQINARMQTVISANTGRDLEAANKYMSDLEAGKTSAVGENQFLDGIKVQSALSASSNNIIQLIELQQYLKASWYNDIGLNSNFNMKREAINEAETKMNNDSLLPLVDDMLDCRVQFIEKVNKMYGTKISVEKSGAWKLKSIEIMQDLTGYPTDNPNSLNDSVKADGNLDDKDKSTPDKSVTEIPVDRNDDKDNSVLDKSDAEIPVDEKEYEKKDDIK